MARQTVNRHIKQLVEQGRGGHRFRSVAILFAIPGVVPISFAIHFLLHGRPLKYISRLLGHRSIDSTEIYPNVPTADGVHFLEGVDFH